MQAVAESPFLARGESFFRVPKCDGVVEGFVGAWDFDELDLTFAPCFERLDPKRWPLVVHCAVVEVVVIFLIALQQTEAFRIFVEKRIKAQGGRIHEWSPDPFAGAIPHRESIGVVDLRAPIISDAAIVFGALVHRGEWCDAHAFDALAWEERGIDLHQGHFAGCDIEGVGTGDRGAVEQRVDAQGAGIFRRFFEPELAEVGELLWAWQSRVDCETACRESVLFVATDCAEITGAEECEHVGIEVGCHADAESGKAKVFLLLGHLEIFAVGEEVLGVGNRAGAAAIDFVNRDRVAKKQSEVEEPCFKLAVLVMPECFFRAVLDRLIVIVVEAFDPCGKFRWWCIVRKARDALGFRDQPIPVEWFAGIIGGRWIFGGAECGACGAPCGKGGEVLENFAAGDHG